jgi:nucleoid DNA-binding protein
VLVGNIEDRPQGSDIQGLSADLLEAARRRNLSLNSLAAYEHTDRRERFGRNPHTGVVY